VAVALKDVVVQFNSVDAGGVIPAVGAVLFCVIVIDSVSVHPLDAIAVTM
jgi:hypothetical protein